MGPFLKPPTFRLPTLNRLAGPPRDREELADRLLAIYSRPAKTEPVSGYWAVRHTGNPLQPFKWVWVQSYWRS